MNENNTQQVKRRYQSAVVVGFVLLAVGLSAACAQYKASTLLITIAPRFSLNAEGAAWVMSIFTLVGIFFALPAGGFAERFGFKRVMLASSGLIIIGSLIGMLSGENGIVLIVSRAIEGISLTFITTCGPIAIQQCVDPRKTALATGIWGCWGNGGAVIASVLTPHIFGVAGFEGVWLAFAIIAALAALLLLFCIKSPANMRTDAGGRGTSVVTEQEHTRYRDLLTPNVVLFLVGFLAFNLIMLAILGMLPSVLQLPEKGFTPSGIGFCNHASLAHISCEHAAHRRSRRQSRTCEATAHHHHVGSRTVCLRDVYADGSGILDCRCRARRYGACVHRPAHSRMD